MVPSPVAPLPGTTLALEGWVATRTLIGGCDEIRERLLPLILERRAQPLNRAEDARLHGARENT
jgi:hypothetical protein